ncbi:hypothetical protein JTE90_001196 [Oedothorax gibbosus]|uniref:Uncharacterized protein n=1 Tax=Oedothorax gibbosus TaxID=931172 RepID=A0AAV6UTS7_9ARAC|nr:hypothetical protein JTE90_001196 [Oedothorax gibbosus]
MECRETFMECFLQHLPDFLSHGIEEKTRKKTPRAANSHLAEIRVSFWIEGIDSGISFRSCKLDFDGCSNG